jgi:hypothetical protein
MIFMQLTSFFFSLANVDSPTLELNIFDGGKLIELQNDKLLSGIMGQISFDSQNSKTPYAF